MPPRSFQGRGTKRFTHAFTYACERRAQIAVEATLYRSLLTVLVLASIASQARAESGLASYYGGHGHRGEMTCAHRTRALGSMVTVVYAGHSIRCRVNDRGPFIRGRIIDVSVSAARALGMMGSGVVRVSLE
jgi:rare lipoprotein A